MAFSRKGLVLSLGPVTTTVRLQQGKRDEKTIKFKQVCCGQGTDENGNERSHDPTPIANVPTCPTCGTVNRSGLLKGQPQGDGYVVVTQEEVAEVREENADFKTKIVLAMHPDDQVRSLTVAGDKMYYLTPEGDDDGGYGSLFWSCCG